MAGIRTKYFSFDDLVAAFSKAESHGTPACVTRSLYDYARMYDTPTIVELGTQQGGSTTQFLQAAIENDGHVFSVDYDAQWGDLTDHKRWTFIHSDSTKAAAIVKAHPAIKKIDLLLIDSLHVRSHVEKEFWAWLPFLADNAMIIFDDIDNALYRKGGGNDSLYLEFYYEDIRQFVEEVFHENEESLDLQIQYGGTGYAVLKNKGAGWSPIKPPAKIVRRTFKPHFRAIVALNTFWMRLRGRR
jgi:predicted O-methyltransferase YrrM